MKTEKTAEVLSILMMSNLYFEITLTERLALVKSIVARMG